MASFASLLKSQISRIARNEIRAETQTLKKGLQRNTAPTLPPSGGA